ncbi:MAG TPA: histone deacetylase [Rhodospirillales bacterium]|nr:histone deacetylase [Rhodospirillales bacterium]
MRPALVFHADYGLPIAGSRHVLSVRARALLTELRRRGLAPSARLHPPRPAPASWLALAHDPDYVCAVLEGRLDAARRRRLGLEPDPKLRRRVLSAVGGTVLAGQLALAEGLACNLAGGGHHASAAWPAGFCLFNDVAVAVRVLRAQGLVSRVLVVDLDVHQGDGTASILAGEPGVFSLSVHCRTNYPARKARSDLDLALEPGTDDALYLASLERLLPPLLARLRPELVFYNAGVDVHREDRLGRLALSDEGIEARDAFVLASCRRAGAAVATVTGGGYGAPEAVAARHALLFEAARLLDG